MEKTYKPDDKIIVNSKMLKEVRPDGQMREYLEEGGEPAIRGLIKWLEDEAKESEFDKPGLVARGRPIGQSDHPRPTASSATTRTMAKAQTSLTRKREIASHNTRWSW